MRRPPRYRPSLARAFDVALKPARHLRLHTTLSAGTERLPAAGSAVLVANHVSWWDGFVLHRLFLQFAEPRARLYTVMLEDQLRRYPLFKSMGCIGIRPGSPSSVAAALNFLSDRARREPVWLAFFPQGAIWPSTKRPLGFRAGVERFAERIPGAPMLPVGIHLEPLNHSRPTAFVAIGPPVSADQTHRVGLEAAVSERLDAIRALIEREGEDSIAAWPDGLLIKDRFPLAEARPTVDRPMGTES